VPCGAPLGAIELIEQGLNSECWEIPQPHDRPSPAVGLSSSPSAIGIVVIFYQVRLASSPDVPQAVARERRLGRQGSCCSWGR
jgi:hypothetical protein